LNEKLFGIELAFVWKKQQECKSKEITNMVKERCNNIERQNILLEMSQNISLTLLEKQTSAGVKYHVQNVVRGKK
jgi:hypothetical protein